MQLEEHIAFVFSMSMLCIKVCTSPWNIYVCMCGFWKVLGLAKKFLKDFWCLVSFITVDEKNVLFYLKVPICRIFVRIFCLFVSDHWLKNVNEKCEIFKCWTLGNNRASKEIHLCMMPTLVNKHPPDSLNCKDHLEHHLPTWRFPDSKYSKIFNSWIT